MSGKFLTNGDVAPTMPCAARERFYSMGESFRRHGLVCTDDSIWLELGGGYRPGRIEKGVGRYAGIPEFPYPPPLAYDRKLGPPPQHVVSFLGSWLVSDAFKRFAEKIDPGGFEFALCDTSKLVINGERPIYWVCDLKRVGDFLDEANSENIKIVEEAPGWRSLLPLSYSRMAVHRDRMGQDAHVFGIIESVSKFCDQHFRDGFKAAKLGPLTFTPA
jgi:hypothetical protein